MQATSTHLHTLDNPAENYVLLIKMIGLAKCNKKLRAIRVLARICHGEDT